MHGTVNMKFKQLLLGSYCKTQWDATKCDWNPVDALKTTVISAQGRKHSAWPRSSVRLADLLMAYCAVKLEADQMRCT